MLAGNGPPRCENEAVHRRIPGCAGEDLRGTLRSARGRLRAHDLSMSALFLEPPDGTGPLEGSLLVLWHGAGGDVDNGFLRATTSAFTRAGARAARARFAYRVAGKKVPDRMPKLMASAREAIAEAVKSAGGPRRIFLGGRSMGGRVASMVVADGDPCDGLIFLSYPLHPPGRKDTLRDEHLERVRCPMLFLQGDRDEFCDLELLRQALEKRDASSRSTVVVYEGRGHSLRRADEREVAEAALRWAADLPQ